MASVISTGTISDSLAEKEFRVMQHTAQSQEGLLLVDGFTSASSMGKQYHEFSGDSVN